MLDYTQLVVDALLGLGNSSGSLRDEIVKAVEGRNPEV